MEPIILRGEPPKAESFGGSGYGYGDGSGYGYGDGSGDGSGDGYGYGYGDGYGYGYGDGSGDGSGDGYGSKEYWLATVPYFASKWTDEQRANLRAAEQAGATIAFWRSKESGLPANGGRKIEAAKPGVVHTSPGPLNLCSAGTLHATLIPPKWDGSRWWVVAMYGEVVWDGDKCGGLKREIIGEAL